MHKSESSDVQKQNLPVIAVFLPMYGIASEIWVKRQAEAFARSEPVLLTWETHRSKFWKFPKKHICMSLPWTSDSFGYRISRNFKLFRCLYRLRECKTVRDHLRQQNASIAICHFGWTASRVYTVLRDQKIPYFIICHGLDLATPALVKSYLTDLKSSIKNAAGVVIVGSHMKNAINQLHPTIDKNKIHQIPCGAPIKSFSRNRPSRRQKDEPLKLISVGRLFEGKGIDLSISAISQLIKSGLNLHFTIVGEGVELSHLSKLSETLGIEQHVTFCGKLQQVDIAKLLKSNHVFLQPSRRSKNGWIEGFGVSITEAMASGLPVIATLSGGIPDQVRDQRDGFLVEEEDYKGIAEAILTYYTSEETRFRHSQNAQKQATNFDSAKLAQKLEGLLLQEIA